MISKTDLTCSSSQRSAYCLAILIFDLDKTISTLESREWKNGQPWYIFCNSFKLAGSASMNDLTPEPTPYQPGNITRLCDQEKTQGMALKPEKSVSFFLEAGRDPTLRPEISLIGVAWKKYLRKLGFSNTSFR